MALPTLPATGIFNRLLNPGGYYLIADPSGAAVFRPRPDLPQVNSVLNDFAAFDKSVLGKAVAARDPNVVATWVGLQVLTPMGRGTLLSIDFSSVSATYLLASVQHNDANGTVRVWKCSDLSIAFV